MKRTTLLLLSLLLSLPPLLAQESATTFSVRDLEGNRFKLEDLKGKVVALNFWFVQCKPCVMEMPELNELVREHQDEEVVFLAFALNGKPELKQFLEKKEFAYRIVPDARTVAEDYAVEAYPTHILIDATGEVTYRSRGFGPSTVSDLNEVLSGMLER
ncbi:MAG: TlpA disulfide reductase family protein [Tunicatimonas sp.]